MNNRIEGTSFNPELSQEYLEIGNKVYEAVEKSSLESAEFVEVGDASFYVMYFDELEENEPQAWFSWNSSLADADIYIFDGLEDREKKRAMFHEILESIVLKEMMDANEDGTEADLSEKSHKLALEQEEERFGKRKEEVNFG